MRDIIIASAIIAGSFIAGLIIEKIILSRIVKLANKTKWRFDDLIIKSLKGSLIISVTLIGIHTSLSYFPLEANTATLLSKIVMVLLVLALTVVAMKIIGGITSIYADSYLPTTTSILRNIVNLIIFVFGLLFIFQTLGINITPVITALGIGGLAVALALQDTLANLFAGLHIIAVRQIRADDFIQLDSGEKGYVMDIGWRNTTIRMLPNNTVIIPNTKLASSIIVNYHLPKKEMSVRVQVGVDYGSDLEHVERVTIEVAKEVMSRVDGAVNDFEPFIRYHTFDNSSINFTVIMRVYEFISQYVLTHEFIKTLHKRYNEEGIVIPFPIRTIVMDKRKTEESAVEDL